MTAPTPNILPMWRQFRNTGFIGDTSNLLYQHRFERSSDGIPLSDVDPVPLDNEINYIWRYSAFRKAASAQSISASGINDVRYDIPVEEYEAMKPALQCASILLARARPFFAMISIAPVRLIQRTRQLFFDPSWTPSEADLHGIDLELLDLSAQYRILRMRPQLPEVSAQGVFSGSVTFTMGHNQVAVNRDHDHDPRAPRTTIFSALASETLIEYTPTRWPRKSEDAKNAMSFALAETLVHELAHALWAKRCQDAFSPAYTGNTYIPEPMVYPYSFSELGHTLSRYLFGGALSWPWGRLLTVFDRMSGVTAPVSRPVLDGAGGMGFVFRGLDHVTALSNYTLAPETIASMFDKNTWLSHQMVLYLLPVQGQSLVVPLATNSDPCIDPDQWATAAGNPITAQPVAQDDNSSSSSDSDDYRSTLCQI